jgi:hypothetical protein
MLRKAAMLQADENKRNHLIVIDSEQEVEYMENVCKMFKILDLR